MKEIKGFFDGYRFLSNYHVADVEYEGLTYHSTEAAYAAAKTLNMDERRKIAAIKSPNKAKKEGRALTLRPDWESVKYSVMEAVCLDKFTRHPDLRKALLDTGDAYLEETNTWGDKIWGVCDGVGTNWLGKILMGIREKLKQESAS